MKKLLMKKILMKKIQMKKIKDYFVNFFSMYKNGK